MMQLSHKTGLEGVTIFGEPSAFNTVNEINYLAFARFGYNAALTWDEFLQNDIGPLLGGGEAATKYLELLKCADTPENLKEGIAQARDIASKQNGNVYRRWLWLQNRLYEKLSMREGGL
jgi:hypothetical protein